MFAERLCRFWVSLLPTWLYHQPTVINTVGFVPTSRDVQLKTDTKDRNYKVDVISVVSVGTQLNELFGGGTLKLQGWHKHTGFNYPHTQNVNVFAGAVDVCISEWACYKTHTAVLNFAHFVIRCLHNYPSVAPQRSPPQSTVCVIYCQCSAPNGCFCDKCRVWCLAFDGRITQPALVAG